MANFLTQAGSDIWDIIRKKLPESFGMQWGVPDVPESAKIGNLARQAINAYSDLPTASNEDISRQIQGRVALSGIGPGPQDNAVSTSAPVAASTPRKSPGDLVTNAASESPLATKPTVVDPAISKTRDVINNMSPNTQSTPASYDIVMPSRSINSPAPVESSDQDRSVNSLRAGREALINKFMEMIGNPKYMAPALSNTVGAINALTGAESGEHSYDLGLKNADLARKRLNQPVAVTGFEDANHAVDMFYPETGARTPIFRGSLPKEAGTDTEAKDLRKFMSDLTMKDFEADQKTVAEGRKIAATEEEKQAALAAQQRIDARKAMFGQGRVGKSQLNPGERIVFKNGKTVVVNKDNIIVREL